MLLNSNLIRQQYVIEPGIEKFLLRAEFGGQESFTRCPGGVGRDRAGFGGFGGEGQVLHCIRRNGNAGLIK